MKNHRFTPVNRSKVPNVVLVGGTGAGKSTVSYLLAKLLGFGVIDLDDLIERYVGKPIGQIFQEKGEFGFRDLETEVIDDCSNVLNHVVVAGAGALENEKNLEKLKKLGPLVWLATPIQEIVHRFVMKPDELRNRPLLKAAVEIEDKEERIKFLESKLEEMMDRRKGLYEQADLSLTFSYGTSEVCAMSIKSMLLKWGSPQGEPDRL